jgi:hypothetical protein
MLKRFALVLLASYAMTVGLLIAVNVARLYLVDYSSATFDWWSGWLTIALWSASFLICWKYLKVR